MLWKWGGVLVLFSWETVHSPRVVPGPWASVSQDNQLNDFRVYLLMLGCQLSHVCKIISRLCGPFNYKGSISYFISCINIATEITWLIAYSYVMDSNCVHYGVFVCHWSQLLLSFTLNVLTDICHGYFLLHIWMFRISLIAFVTIVYSKRLNWYVMSNF